MSKLSVLATDAPAKINLTLEVHGPRGDGFHELRSLVIGVGLADHLRCVPHREGGEGLRFRCDEAALAGEDNLAWRAARRFAEHWGRPAAFTLELAKRIPVGGGLGGGSSDAAAALRLCDRHFEAGAGSAELARLGAELGSDVPLFFALPGAVMTGRGEVVEPVKLAWSGWVVLVPAGVAVSTVEVYRAWRAADARGCPRGSDEAARSATSAAELGGCLTNELEPAVFRTAPKVAEVFDSLSKLGEGPVRVSGAGSVLYLLCDNEEQARARARRIDEQKIGVGTLIVSAPVGVSPIVSS